MSERTERIRETIPAMRGRASVGACTVLDYIEDRPDVIDAMIAAHDRAIEAERRGYRHSYQYRAQAETHCLWCLWPHGEGPTYCGHGYIGVAMYGEGDDIETTIRDEETRYIAMLDRWHTKLPAMIPDPTTLTGETLCLLHQTHGLDPATVGDILGITIADDVLDDYETAYERHRQTGRAKGFDSRG